MIITLIDYHHLPTPGLMQLLIEFDKYELKLEAFISATNLTYSEALKYVYDYKDDMNQIKKLLKAREQNRKARSKWLKEN